MATKTHVICDVDFASFQKAVHDRWVEMSKNELFATECGETLFDEYLKAFPVGTDPIVKSRTHHDCQTCKQFVRRLGHLVNIRNGKAVTMWEGLELPFPYNLVAERMAEVVKASPVKTVFRTKERSYGVEYNYGPDKVRHDHFYGTVADRHFALDPEAKRGEQDAIHQVMSRGLAEIRQEDLSTVLDLIESNGLYRGEEHKAAVVGFLDLHRQWSDSANKELFVWERLGDRNARFRNTVIGTLLVDLAEGKELDQAVKAFETKVAPANYKRPTAVITQRMVDQAIASLTDLGLLGAINRRYARLSDVSVNDVLFVDNSTKGQMKDGVSELLASVVKKASPDLSHATKIAADRFVEDVLPGAKSLEAMVENRHQGNFVSLTGSDDPARLFKWDNPFAWSYDGDMADSVKQRVKAAGGNVTAKMRVSLSWFNYDDLDLHAKMPNGTQVFFGNKAGILDVDMNAGAGRTRTPVENLAFTTLQDGVYVVWVKNYNRRETIDTGFAIEVEYGGTIHQHNYAKAVQHGENVQCFRLHVVKGELVKIEASLPGGTVPQEKWGVKTESLVPVAAAMWSPNHWGDNKVGAKHLIFALKGCKNPGFTRGIFNEFLRGDLDSSRKVFEALGSKSKCPYSDEQISGVGFTAARGDSVVVVVDGKRAYNLVF